MAVRADYSGNATPTVAEWNSYILNGGLQYLSEYTVEYDLLAIPPTPLVTNIGLDFCFSYPASQYRNFRVVLGNLQTTVSPPATSIVIVQMKNGTVPAGPALYNYASRTVDGAGTPTNYVAVNNTAWAFAPLGAVSSTKGYLVFDICSPQSSAVTSVYGRGNSYVNQTTTFSGQLNNITAYDGLSITAFGITLSGSCQVYGYRSEI